MGGLDGLASLSDSSALLDDAAALRRRAQRDGYLYLRRLLPPAVVEALRRQAEEACVEAGWLSPDGRLVPGAAPGDYGEPAWVAMQCRVLPAPQFRAVGDDPALLGVLEGLYGEPPLTRRGDLCRVFAPASAAHTTPPHQDHFYVGGSRDVWTAWVPLGPCPVELGGLAVAPGSHRAGALDHSGDGLGRQQVDGLATGVWTTADYDIGDVVLFNCLTVHRSFPNRTADRLRLSADFRYQPASHPLPAG